MTPLHLLGAVLIGIPFLGMVGALIWVQAKIMGWKAALTPWFVIAVIFVGVFLLSL